MPSEYKKVNADTETQVKAKRPGAGKIQSSQKPGKYTKKSK